MKSLLRLYPRSWRKRYGAEMEVLVDQMGGRLGVGLDLVVGAARAYRDVIAGNRILSAAGACLHGFCVAVLVQAIALVSMILIWEQSSIRDFGLGPIDFVTMSPSALFGLHQLSPAVWVAVYRSWLPDALLLVVLLAALALVLATPRLVRRLG